MVTNKVIASVFALLIGLSTLNVSAMDKEALEQKAKSNRESAQWFFNVRTNVNSAAILAGLTSGAYFLGNSVLEIGKHILRCKNIDHFPSMVYSEKIALENIKDSFVIAAGIAGLALTYHAFDKLYLRHKYYEKKNAADAAEQALKTAQEVS